MPRASAFSSTPEAWSAGYMRKRLPQPMARMETDAPVRPRVRWGMGVAAAAAPAEAERAGSAAAAPAARPLFSRNSRRVTFSRFVIACSDLSRLDAGRGQVLGHHLRVVREGDLRLFDVRV